MRIGGPTLVACLLAALNLVLAAAPACSAGQPQLPLAQASLGAANLKLELAVSPRERYQGLSGREDLPPGRGMVFIFADPGRMTMVMRGMRFALDFVWLRDNRVVGITHQVPPPQPGQPPQEAAPPQAIDMVIELPAGSAQAHGLAVGQRLIWQKGR